MRAALLFVPLLALACSGDKSGETGADPDGTDDTGEGDSAFPTTSCADHPDPCVEVLAGDNDGLFEISNLLVDNQTIVLGQGEWQLDNQVTFRGANGVSLIGQGMELTVLDFAAEEVQTNGVDAIGDNLLLQGMTIRDAKKDGVRVEDSDGVTMRDLRASWTTPQSPENGAYGLYPVKSSRVLIEDCEAHNAADAGIYVGQTQYTIVRNNLATGNVAGIEIENTQFADVYGNTATGNTGGLLIFDLPGNPIVGRDVWVHDNVITDNNTPNFAPGGTVAIIPAGTGTVVVATRRVIIEDNEYANNNSSDIAIMSGLVVEGDASQWLLTRDELLGETDGVTMPEDDAGVYNYVTRNVVLKGNSHSGSGSLPDGSDPEAREIGALLALLYLGQRVDDVLYDAIGESAFDATDPAGNSNDNHICLGGNSGGTFASLDLEVLAGRIDGGEFPSTDWLFRPEAPFAPFDCTELDGDPIPTISVD